MFITKVVLAASVALGTLVAAQAADAARGITAARPTTPRPIRIIASVRA
jgi:hypothetical protein